MRSACSISSLPKPRRRALRSTTKAVTRITGFAYCSIRHRCEARKSNNRAVRLGKQDRIRPGCGKLPDLLCRQRNGDRVTEFAQQSADGGGVFRRTWPDLGDHTPPIPKSPPTRQAAFSPWPVNTTTVV